MSEKKKVMFICLGNICRSPIAEAVFKQVIKERGEVDKWEVDSAAIGPWHVGNNADRRALSTLKAHNIDFKHTVKQIKKDDFKKFDYIFGMDNENISDLNRLAPKSSSKNKILLLGSFDPNGEKIIRDPYYDSDCAGFEKCYEQCVRSCNGFLDSMK